MTSKVRSGEARFGAELDGEKLWRGQVFGARMGARQERKVFCIICLFLYRDSEGVTSKVRSGEVRFGSELGARKERKVFCLIYLRAAAPAADPGTQLQLALAKKLWFR